MKSFRRHAATVNAGSMADIAFLLLIFFLVTTTISADKGLLRQLPSECQNIDGCIENIAERNILRIFLNKDQNILVEDKVVSINEIENLVMTFVDNNGNNNCDYCDGLGLNDLSQHPKQAVISLSHSTLTKYSLFIEVQDEITKAYYNLRSRYIKSAFNKLPHEITDEELRKVKAAYPFIVSEASVKN